MSLGIGPML